MDTGVKNALMGIGSGTGPHTGLLGFSTDAMTQLAVIVPIGILVMVTIVLVFKSLGWFKKLSGLRAR